jgi:hypothetical protein
MDREKGKASIRQIEKNLPARRLARRLRVVFMVLIALSVVWFFMQFGFSRVPQGNDAMEGVYAPGMRLVYDRFFDYHGAGCAPSCNTADAHLARNACVFFKKEWNGERREFISQVVAAPGDSLKTAAEGGKAVLFIGPDRKRVEMRAYKSGFPDAVPPRKFVVLNANPDSQMPDSRDFGLLDADEISSKIVATVGF